MTRYLITAKDAAGHFLSLCPDPAQLNDADAAIFVDSPAQMLDYVAQNRTGHWFDASGDDGWVPAEVSVYEARPDAGNGRFDSQFYEIHYPPSHTDPTGRVTTIDNVTDADLARRIALAVDDQRFDEVVATDVHVDGATLSMALISGSRYRRFAVTVTELLD